MGWDEPILPREKNAVVFIKPCPKERSTTMALDAATLALVANELNSTLLDAKIDKIFEPTRDEVLMTLRTRTQTFKLLLSARSGSARVCLTKESFENPLTPPGFCMLLRKHLTGGRLTGLHMEPGDRIVFLTFCAPMRWATW